MSNIRPFQHHRPNIHPSAWVDHSAVVIGQVELAESVSVWPMTVIRGDIHRIQIGARSNVQDGSVLHVTQSREGQPEGSPLIIGEDVTVGHKAVLHGCTIGNRVLIGMGSIVLDDAVIEDDVVIGAGSLVPPRKRLESGYLYIGSPVKQARPLTDGELAFLKQSAENYVNYAQAYRNGETEQP
ncbi:gamma carbonic anhydrase family protein [Neisseria animalis]|uniref:Gamma carbonic anhydrase family protein n=1 Tax=Neisseria animalis TaxID=492 RepID=A0A5P3MS80_NEIAN|nr:gamma carbonic anhydrase family protein [Neisseria animalis]QEY24434.1 gamma carbonic anhydrase family protein [Neisseria animalis]ROW31908.1 gamma carbonic anhydrase family protein [Neisseria animalis]VEE07052.1 putative transferase [Neisseria animalis]